MGQFICGKRSVMDALEHELPITRLYIQDNVRIQVPKGIKVIKTTKAELDKMVYEQHQGMVAELKEINYYTSSEFLDEFPQKILVLDHIQDPHNLGAILRTANAAGFRHVLIAKNRAAQVNSTVLKVASGGQINIKIARTGSMVNFIQKAKDKGYWVYVSALTDKAKQLDHVTFNDPMVVVVGNESSGVSNSIVKQAHEVVKIPMKGTVQSLNVSVATGILLFQIP